MEQPEQLLHAKDMSSLHARTCPPACSASTHPLPEAAQPASMLSMHGLLTRRNTIPAERALGVCRSSRRRRCPG